MAAILHWFLNLLGWKRNYTEYRRKTGKTKYAVKGKRKKKNRKY